MKTWCELSIIEREEYVNQDFVRRDPRMVYVPTYYLDNMDSGYGIEYNDELNQDDWEFVLRAKLTERQKQCLYKHKWEDKTQQLIADELNIPQQVVSMHIKHALRKIHRLIEGACFQSEQK